jgi:hypothetical protein
MSFVPERDENHISHQLHAIVETLQRQQEDLKRNLDDTGVSSVRTSELLDKLAELRRRAVETGIAAPDKI